MDKLRLLDLFSGIGGFSLGLERSGGFETVAFCEIEPFPRRVLAKHWPEVPCYHDIKELTAARLAADGIAVDAICGGFPCQDISTAGKGAGIEGERSGLWGEYARLIGELRPRVVFVENVAALLGRGLDRVLGDLASLGYDAWWDCIPASAVGAPHRRDRLWLVGYTNRSTCEWGAGSVSGTQATVGSARKLDGNFADRFEHAGQGGAEGVLAHAIGERGCGRHHPREDAIHADPRREDFGAGIYSEWWATEPDVGRVAHGVPARVDRLRCLGNAVVPQVAYVIGCWIREVEARQGRGGGA